VHVSSSRLSDEGTFAAPKTAEGRWATAFAVLALALGALGEAARQGGFPGPFYSIAFFAGLLGGGAATIAVRRGERSLVAFLGFAPLLIGAGFGVAELLG
jgi:hypothetical protein